MDFMGKRARFVCGFVILDCGLNWGVKGSSVTVGGLHPPQTPPI